MRVRPKPARARSLAVVAPEKTEAPSSKFAQYTTERYNRSVGVLAKQRGKIGTTMIALAAAISAVLLVITYLSHDPTPSVFVAGCRWIWMIPVPFFVVSFRGTPKGPADQPDAPGGRVLSSPSVIFQVTAIGKNTRALQETVGSVQHWVRNTPRLGFRFLLWVVVEPDGYRTDPAVYERMRRDGVEVFVVPEKYETPLGTRGKARALEFACERRRERGLSTSSVWVLPPGRGDVRRPGHPPGISEFVRDGQKLVGAGLIVYPIDWTGSPSHVQELTRTYDDFRVLDSLTMPGQSHSGVPRLPYPGPGGRGGRRGLGRARLRPGRGPDVRDRVRAKFGSVFGVLKGYAYEKGAFSLKDQLKQRRRWMHGVLFALSPRSQLPGEAEDHGLLLGPVMVLGAPVPGHPDRERRDPLRPAPPGDRGVHGIHLGLDGHGVRSRLPDARQVPSIGRPACSASPPTGSLARSSTCSPPGTRS